MALDDKWEIWAERQIWSSAIALRIGTRSAGGFHVMEPAVFRGHEQGEFVPPSLVMPHDAAQRLMDELWHQGCRPSQAVGSVGQLESVKYHLEDMRRLVFGEGKK